MQKMELGCGLYGLAHELEENFWGTMQTLCDAGFTAVEPLFAFRNDPVLLPDSPLPAFLRAIMWDEKKILDCLPWLEQMGLNISSLHIGLMFGTTLEEGIPQMIELAGKTGIRHFYTSLEFEGREKTMAAAELMNKAQTMLSGSGVTLGYHNHAMEFRPMTAEESCIECFLRETVPEVKLQLDVGWQMFGGSEILPFIERYGDRINSVHLKDFVNDFENVAQEDAFAAVGDGALPAADVLRLTSGLKLIENGLMIDQDRAAKGQVLSDDLKKGAHYVRTLTN